MSLGGTLLSAALWFAAPWVAGARALAVVVSMYDQRRDARKAFNRARDAYNASLVDRLQPVEAQAAAPRRMVLGTVRIGGQQLRRPWSTGANREKLTMVLEFAGHEVDQFVQWYADDTLLTLDGGGWVQTPPYFKERTETAWDRGTLDGAGAVTAVLPHTPLSGSVVAVSGGGGGDGDYQLLLMSVSVSGSTVTATGGSPGAPYEISYQHATGTSLLRIRSYRGTPTQSVGGDLAAEYPGDMRATDHYRGIALAVVDVIFDSDVFTSGPPKISAVLKGARVLDPRDNSTAWSQNPAVLAYHYARHPNGLAMPADELLLSDWTADADVCDESVDYTVRKPGESPEIVTLPRYRAGMVIDLTADVRAQFGELLESMAGRWGWQGGILRVRAGALRPTVGTVDQEWLHAAGDGNEPWIKIANGTPREAKVNAVTGSCVDDAQRYQVLPFPRIADDVLAAQEGSYPLEVELQAVNHIAHAQHLGSIMIRESQASLRMEMQTGLHGYRAELFDVLSVTLPRYGMVDKLMEVIGWRWHPTEGVTLRLAEITADLFTPVAELVGRDPAPDSNLPLPWQVPRITGVAATSNTAAVADGSIITRLVVSWDAVGALAVASSGQIEVQYRDMSQPAPAGEWPSWTERGDATQAVIPGVVGGRPYLVRVRAIRGVPYVRGDWSDQVLHITAARRQSVIYRQASAPAGSSVLDGDEWYDTDDGNKHHVRVSGAWVAVPVGTGAIDPNAATVVTSDDYNFAGAGASGGSYTVRRTLSVTPSVDCTIEFSATAAAKGVHPDAAQNLEWWAVRSGSADLPLGAGYFGSTTAQGNAVAFSSFSAAGGVQIDFELRTRAGSGVAVQLWQTQMRVTQVRR